MHGSAEIGEDVGLGTWMCTILNDDISAVKESALAVASHSQSTGSMLVPPRCLRTTKYASLKWRRVVELFCSAKTQGES